MGSGTGSEQLALKNGMAGTEPGGLRLKYGFWVVIAGLAVVAAVFVTATLRWSAASDVTTAVSSVTGVVGTIVGAFFGMQLGSAGREKAEAARDRAESLAQRLAAALPPEVAQRLVGADKA